MGRPGVDRLHRRHGHRRGARPQRPAPVAATGSPTTASWSWRPRSACSTIDPAKVVAEGPAPARAACSSSTPPRAASSTTTRSRTALAAAAALRRVAPRRPRPPRRPARRATSSRRSTRRSCSTSGCSATRTRSSRSSSAPMARTGAEPIGSMGTDTPDRRAVRPAAPAVRLLPAAVRPGHQPAARRHPRGAGHVASARRSAPRATCSSPARRRAARSCCRYPIIDNDELAKLLYINDDGDMPGLQALRHRRPLPGGRGRRGPAPRRSRTIRAKVSDGHRRRRQAHHPVRPALDRRAGADPVAAAHVGACTTT